MPSAGVLVGHHARIHSRAKLRRFARSTGVGLFRQPHAIPGNSSNSFADRDDIATPTTSAFRPLMRFTAPSSIVQAVGPLLTIGAGDRTGGHPFESEGHKQTPVSAFIRDRRACVRSMARLLDALRHLGHAHQWPGELVEKLIGVLLFAQGELSSCTIGAMWSCWARFRAVI